MSSGSYYQVDVRCPFYLTDDGRYKVTCEGISDASRINLRFLRTADYHVQMETFCCRHYDRCEVYQAAMMKYE